MALKARVAIAAKPVANPSKPSVRLTAFEAPVITKIVRGIYSQPISIIPFETNGIEMRSHTHVNQDN